MNLKFKYQSEKLSDAVRLLMLPHPEGEAMSIANAFNECQIGLHGLKKDEITDESALKLLNILSNLMSIDGLDDPTERGLFVIKAESLTLDEKLELSRVLYELSSWFKLITRGKL